MAAMATAALHDTWQGACPMAPAALRPTHRAFLLHLAHLLQLLLLQLRQAPGTLCGIDRRSTARVREQDTGHYTQQAPFHRPRICTAHSCSGYLLTRNEGRS